jgi:hypothetical protein
MKIAIFGCSFACMNSNPFSSQGFNSHGRPWMKILLDDFGHDITSYGESGSSVYFSYRKFKDNYKNFDKIIFLATHPDRKSFVNMDNLKHFNIGYGMKKYSWVSQFEFELVRNYYMHIDNMQENTDMRELMIEEVKKISGDALLYIDIPTTVSQLEQMEELKRLNYDNIDDRRWCHMSNENNYIFATQINDWLKGLPFEFNLNKFIKPSIEELSSYYKQKV